jgi:hypothetical protein
MLRRLPARTAARTPSLRRTHASTTAHTSMRTACITGKIRRRLRGISRIVKGNNVRASIQEVAPYACSTFKLE